jgi:hypothetical protein
MVTHQVYTMSVKSLLVSGSFTEADLAELFAVFRQIERRRPHENFFLAIVEADLSANEAEAMIQRLFPRIEGDDPTFVSMNPEIPVIMPDGSTGLLKVDLAKDTFQDFATMIALRGSVDGVRGTAWRQEDGNYKFEATPIS